jgi:hypothetical protein
MLMFREEKSPEDEIKAWQFWHGRQHSVKQRILDAGKILSSFVRLLLNKTINKIHSSREDNIKMDLQEVGGGCGDSMELVRDRDRWRVLVSTVRNFRVPKMRGIS